MKEISPEIISDNPFKLIGRDWMLITAVKKDQSVNTMTASWGGVGVLWNKNVCFVFIRPQRYTYEFVEQSDSFTLSFYPNEMRDALTFCGRNSGRDCDKISLSGLVEVKLDDTVYFEGARLVLKVKKLYKTQLEEKCFIDPTISQSVYPSNDYHYVYVCEIEKALMI